ncbi:hypothetical protein GCM10011361_09600 [Muriicola marianensis]|uniref:Peptidase E n=2 Tax=Muriicola marianensis TaxID=1324801 RepID=A0ABQ1QT22_9FLAO|nr:hypothetical protein GCM10011361_09600 [Muriicola marianensis]
MNISKLLLLFLCPLLLAFAAHKFYVSVTQVEYYAPDQAIQITSRVFIDDLEKALLERYDVELLLGTPEEVDDADDFIDRYLNSKFLVRVNGVPTAFYFLGKKVDNDILILFLEIPNISLDGLKSIEIQNEVLMDVYEEQKNIVHFRFGDLKKSFVLLREKNSGMLNF